MVKSGEKFFRIRFASRIPLGILAIDLTWFHNPRPLMAATVIVWSGYPVFDSTDFSNGLPVLTKMILLAAVMMMAFRMCLSPTALGWRIWKDFAIISSNLMLSLKRQNNRRYSFPQDFIYKRCHFWPSKKRKVSFWWLSEVIISSKKFRFFNNKFKSKNWFNFFS